MGELYPGSVNHSVLSMGKQVQDTFLLGELYKVLIFLKSGI
jgi:hypothetical protein